MTLIIKFTKVLTVPDEEDLCVAYFGKQVQLFGKNPKCVVYDNEIHIQLGIDNEVYPQITLTILPGLITIDTCDIKYRDNLPRNILVPLIPNQVVHLKTT